MSQKRGRGDMQGWIKLHRKLLENPIFNDPHLLKLWIYCLLKATHKERKQIVGKQIVELKPGQFVTGRFSLAKEYNRDAKPKDVVSDRTLWRWMKFLEESEFLSIKSTTKYSVVTINNWDKYQDNDQQMSSKCPSNVQQVSTNKNDKNVENISTTTPDPIAFFEQNLCPLSPYQMQLLIEWEQEFDGNKEIINEAIRIADNRNRRYFGFVEFLLKEWKNNNLKTIDQVRAYENNRFKQQSKVVPMKKASEIDWEAL